MHIVRLNAENIKRLSAVEIAPNGNLVEITGKNGQGKTSVLDAIYWALAGTKPIQGKPVRDGADTGSVTLDLGEYVVTRKFRVRDDGEYTTSLTVANKDGAKYSDPQKLLNALVGDLTFDPLDFSRMKPLDQVIALRALVPDYDFVEADRLSLKDFNARTEVNRDIRDLQARVEAIIVPDGTPDERVDLAALMEELQKDLEANEAARRHAEKVNSHTAAIATLEEEIQRGRSDIARLQAEIANIEKNIAARELGIEEHRDLIDDLGLAPAQIDTADVRQRIAESETINRNVELKKQRRKLNAELRDKTEESANLTGSIAVRKAAAAKAVRDADLPVEGLELTEDGVLLNGVPFDQASDAEQLRVSIAVAGAMNPRLRVIRVRDGSLLDDDSMAALASYAEANGLQVWVETVQSGREAAIVIEDGHVAKREEAGSDA
ncbi:conserved hypothetical protein [uncultured Pleomorphomonas sp.]|uniref:Rad50/SbcC-type AAA domain-containing protein n=1 Tax=uncultured Pleomorphomonas sp. TaxID=442121 RepID=A0A212LQP7_9HYPH|nr:AAA family ATPase [uncultured Pleomorphomonas sp.]SCM79836.1 conserved hypothetical protein [uncultured Pleomorphomonas sp.]